MTEQRKFPWGWTLLGLGALIGVGAAAHAHAAGTETALQPWEDPNLTHEKAAKLMYDELIGQLRAKGLNEGIAYPTPTGNSEIMIDQRNTPNKISFSQQEQEAWLHFKWPTNALLTYKNFGAGGETWDQYVQFYKAAKDAVAAVTARA